MRRVFLIALAAGVFRGPLFAQPAAAPEPLSAWRYFKEIRVPPASTGLMDFLLDLDTLDNSRANGADLRLYNGAGREIPYILRVRRAIETSNAFAATEFDRGVAAGAAQVSLDLSGRAQQHNQVEIESAGDNFRRLVDVEGSSDGAQWSTLVSGAIIFSFSAGGREVQQLAVTYPTSRYRYLRVRVYRDPQVDRGAPELLGVRVRRSIQVQGETVSFAGNMEGREADRIDGRPASVWRVDLNGRVPIQGVVLTVADATFSRPFRLEAIDDPAAPAVLASGELIRSGDGASQTSIDFSEHYARRLKLTITDDRNPPLSIRGIMAQSAAREVIFESEFPGGVPLRLYYGNPKAQPPHYDLAVRLPADVKPSTRLFLGPRISNPIYRPAPKPFSERAPWVVYVVLSAAVVALAAILLSLARASALTEQ